MDEIISREEQQTLVALTEEFVSALPEEDIPETEIRNLLCRKMQEHLPDCHQEEIQGYSLEITEAVAQHDRNLSDLNTHIKAGKSRESWLHSKLKEALAVMPLVEQNAYLNSLDQALKQANEAFDKTIHNLNGSINQNPNLDGIIAEQFHAQTFNLDAAAKKLTAKADVPQINGKNSMDIGVRHTPGGTPDARYQDKFGKTAEDTIKYIKEGNYNNQQLIVPADQVEEVRAAFPNRKVTAVIDFDGAQGKSLTKAEAKALQKKAQSGQDVHLDWNEYSVKALAKELCEQTGKAALIGAAVGAVGEVITEKKNGEPVQPKKVAQKAFQGGTDFGVKCMAAGALKVAAEKGLVHAIPKGTPAAVISAIAYSGIECAKVAYKMGKGECTVTEGLGKMQDVALSTAGGVLCAAKGAAIGAKIGAAIGCVVPGAGNVIGAAVGSVVGGAVGYMAGSTVGKAVSSGLKKIGQAAVKGLQRFGSALKESAKAFTSALGLGRKAQA